MKKILLVAATDLELRPFFDFLGPLAVDKTGPGMYEKDDRQLRICITGAGMMQSAAHIMEAVMAFQPDVALQAGIGGSFDLDLPLGSLLLVGQEMAGDIGAEDEEGFTPIADMGFADKDAFPFRDGWLDSSFPDWPCLKDLPRVKGLTVNTISGISRTIEQRRRRYGCVVESMEGAAFHYVCLCKKIPFVQLRAVSNYVEPRNKDRWEIGKAVNNLNDWLRTHIFTI
ncbi:MAG TPA: futalosine hydrolase [Edaphocola sp.]|nr:futalosine hydrolase [Edaphocola sp.]